MAESKTHAAQTPLLELLRKTPQGGVHTYFHSPTCQQHIPYGKHCHDAANRIEQLERELAAANERADKAEANIARITKAANDTKYLWEQACDRAEKAEKSIACVRQAAFAEIVADLRRKANRGRIGAEQQEGTVAFAVYASFAAAHNDLANEYERAALLPPTHVCVQKEQFENIRRALERGLIAATKVADSEMTDCFQHALNNWNECKAAHEGNGK